MPSESIGTDDVRTVHGLLDRIALRLRLERALRVAAWGPLAILLAPPRLRRVSRDAASVAERRDPRFKNVLITADEILRGIHQPPRYVSERVFGDAAKLGAEMDVRAAVPLGWATAIGVAGLAAWLVVLMTLVWNPYWTVADPRQASNPPPAPPHGWQFSATIVPPPYTGRRAETLRNPDRVEALQGSALSILIEPGAPAVRARTGSQTRALTIRDGSGQSATLRLTESGFIALESDGVTRLIAVSVVPDRPPSVSVTVPGRDLLLPDAKRRIAIAGEARDDIAVTRFELRYTTISGSGEQFEFREGSVPLTIGRRSPTDWKGQGTLTLGELGLGPGDSVIYRLVAADGRGGAGMAASDSYLIDIAAPGQATLAGFELPPDRDRYALSQQMILLKIERLHARRSSLAPEALQEQALTIAAEQRMVRSTFVFLLGGEVQDEEEEAAHAHEIEEGRLENAARRDMLEAVRHMSLVEARLTPGDTGGAIPPARAAVAALERAFGHRRYFLRTLPVRSLIDPSRRLTGDLSDARDADLVLPRAAESAESRAARDAIAELTSLTASAAAPASLRADDIARRLGKAAERVLALDPSDPDLQAVSLRLARRAAALSTGAAAETARADLQTAVETVLARAARAAPRAIEADSDVGPLKGRWLAALGDRR